jgi:hypothetical protein
MNETIKAADASLATGDIAGAWGAFESLRPNARFGLEGLKLSTRIHIAAKHWPEVDVLCRVLRKDYPSDPSGFMHSAESLYEQGRFSEAIQVLKQWPMPESESVVMAAIERYQAASDSAERQAT